MNADLTDGRCRVVGTRQLLKKLASDEISVLYVAKDAQREITEKLTALAEGNRVEIVTVETMEKLGDMCGIAVRDSFGRPNKRCDFMLFQKVP